MGNLGKYQPLSVSGQERARKRKVDSRATRLESQLPYFKAFAQDGFVVSCLPWPLVVIVPRAQRKKATAVPCFSTVTKAMTRREVWIIAHSYKPPQDQLLRGQILDAPRTHQLYTSQHGFGYIVLPVVTRSFVAACPPWTRFLRKDYHSAVWQWGNC